MNRKTILLLALIYPLSFSLLGQANPQYDSILAKKLGADDYGMKMYTLVILKSGPNEISDTQKRDSLFAGHLQNI